MPIRAETHRGSIIQAIRPHPPELGTASSESHGGRQARRCRSADLPRRDPSEMRFPMPRLFAALAFVVVHVSGSVVAQAPPARVDIPLNARTRLALTNGRVIPMHY